MNKEDHDRLVELNTTIEEAMYEVNNLLKGEGIIYEQWKAGGKAVTDEFVSMYPSLSEVIERLTPDDEDTDEEEAI